MTFDADQTAADVMKAKRVGRPVSGIAKTNAERQAAYRNRHVLVPAGEAIPQTIARLAKQFDLPESAVTRELLRFALCNRNWGKLGFPGLRGK